MYDKGRSPNSAQSTISRTVRHYSVYSCAVMGEPAPKSGFAPHPAPAGWGIRLAFQVGVTLEALFQLFQQGVAQLRRQG